MKKILYFLLLNNLLFALQSKYPLGFSFEEKTLFLASVDMVTYENNKTSVLGINFFNNEDHYFLISNNIVYIPKCKIDTIYQFKNINSYLSKGCMHVFKLNGEKKETIKLKEFVIIIYNAKNSPFSTAFIFCKNKYIATISSDMNYNDFKKILLTIRKTVKTNSKNINSFIDKSKKYLNKGLVNKSLKEVVNAFLIDPNNHIVHRQYHKIMKFKIKRIKLFDNFYHRYK